MPSDAERFRLLAKFRLHVAFHGDHVTLMWLWQEKVLHWEASPPHYPVASGKTLEEATDAAIARYNRKHGVASAPSHDVVVLHVRGWVS
jgi:hypothetical protein